MALDKSRPYGEVYGEGVTHRYEQDGKRFDNSENEIADEAPPPSPADESPAVGDALDGMNRDQLHAMAKDLGIKVHPKSGSPKVREAIREAGNDTDPDQVSAQMAG